jgi:hypothetical protein
MALNWKGDQVKRTYANAAALAIDATMSAAIMHAKQNHSAGAHGMKRFVTQKSPLERSIRIKTPARQRGGTIVGTWGSIGIVYARRIEMGFQGKDSAGRVFNQPAFPFLRPAADVEYPKLAGRIRRAASRA